MSLGVGIDTGGTYTDTVVYDITGRKILASAKTLTTKHDLSEGILASLDALPQDLLRQAKLISLSTTLATNACVENKGGRAKLIFMGVDRKVASEVGGEYGLPPAVDICFVDCATRMNGAIDAEPDWEAFERDLAENFQSADSVGIVEIHSQNNNAVLEKKARDLVKKHYDVPVVCGCELSMALNSIQRGAGTLLNARLIPVIQEFLSAVTASLARRGVSAPIVVVRSDGSLMSENFTNMRPVETLLSGPAASVIGGMELTGERDAVVVDMGGTTTDCAIIRDGDPVKAVGGINIGSWKTFVKGLYVDTFGLGGDSELRHKDGRLNLGETRVVPLTILADRYPYVVNKLEHLLQVKYKHTKPLHEFYALMKDITDNHRYNDKERAFCDTLKNGPLMLQEAMAAIGEDVYTASMTRLEAEGVVLRAGLTPTDIMHITGDFVRHENMAATLAARFVSINTNMSVKELCDAVYHEVKRKIYYNIVRILLEDQHPSLKHKGLSPELAALINDSWDKAVSGEHFMTMNFRTPASLIGIGAPTHVFLPDVAKALGTKCVIPEYAGVANALGAIIGDISASVSIEIKPGQYGGYTVFGLEENKHFHLKKDAEACARKMAADSAVAEAKRRGSTGDISVKTEVKDLEADMGGQMFYLDTTVTATAVSGF